MTLNITNYGGVGDAVQFWVNAVSNSVVLTTTNQLSSADIGKTIEVFRVGTPTYGLDSYGNTNGFQDLIATITNVVDSTNIYISLPCQLTTNNTFATYGTDNTLAFSNAMAVCFGYTNVTIYIPAGTYLCMPILQNPSLGYAYGAIVVTQGGIHFVGENQTNTTLLSRGAWRLEFASPYPARGFLFEIRAPFTNNYPFSIENLTLDGGVLQGNTPVHGIACNPVDGLGWDQQHSAYLACDVSGLNRGTLAYQVLTNVTIQHWRGEMVKSIDQNTNGNIDIENCFFGDGNASALNCFQSWNVVNNTFSNVFLIAEYAQDYHTNTSYFCNNFTTNITGNAWAFDVVTKWNEPPFIMESNTFWFNGYGCNGIQTSPGVNISILNNQIHCANYATVFVIGGAGSQGTICNSNILISGNSIYADADNAIYPGNEGKLNWIFTWGAQGIQAVHDLTVCSNNIYAPADNTLIYAASYSDNISFHDNNCGASPQNFTIFTNGGGLFPLIQSNNTYIPYPVKLNYGLVQTNLVSYGFVGPAEILSFVANSNIFVLQDSCPLQIPLYTPLCIDNRSNTWVSQGKGNGDVWVEPSQFSNSGLLLPYGTEMTFYWTGTIWTTNNGGIIRVTPGSLSYGSVFTGTNVTKSFTVQNIGIGTLSGAVSVSAPFSVLSGGTYNLAPNQSQTVQITFSPVAVGSFNQSVTFTGGAGTNVTVSGSAASPAAQIQVSTGSIVFGSIAKGASLTNVISVQNIGGSTLNGTASVSSPFTIVSGGSYSLGASQSQSIVVAFNPTSATTFSQNITLTGGGGATVALSGAATNAPVIQITPANVSYGSIVNGLSATNSFKVQNVGSGTLTGAVNVAAPFIVLSGGTYNLSAGQSQTVVVAFSPGVIGSYTQSVTFTGGNGANATVSGTSIVDPLTPPSNLKVTPLTTN